MARPKLHNFPPQNMLASIGRLLRAALDEEKAIVADARAKQAAEKRAMERSNQAREAAGKSYREWYDLHPDPPTSGVSTVAATATSNPASAIHRARLLRLVSIAEEYPPVR